MTLTDKIVKDIVKHVIMGQDYRIEIVNVINAEFLQFTVDFFKKIVGLKLKNKNVINWYKKEFLNSDLSKEEIAINSGLNIKTIKNMYKTSSKEVVIDAANEHFDGLYKLIEDLIDAEEDLSLTLTIKFNGVAVDLTINETLIVTNALAVKRAALRGGAWSTAGKTAEKVLMKTLCQLYKVPAANYDDTVFIRNRDKKIDREIDFFLKDNSGKKYLCEIKLMGQGNPESADAIFARSSNVFVADTLSKQNKNQAENLGVSWVELRTEDGYKRLTKAFDRYNIPYTDFNGDLEKNLDLILKDIIR